MQKRLGSRGAGWTLLGAGLLGLFLAGHLRAATISQGVIGPDNLPFNGSATFLVGINPISREIRAGNFYPAPLNPMPNANQRLGDTCGTLPPSGTFYRVDFRLTGSSAILWTEYWKILQIGGTATMTQIRISGPTSPSTAIAIPQLNVSGYTDGLYCVQVLNHLAVLSASCPGGGAGATDCQFDATAGAGGRTDISISALDAAIISRGAQDFSSASGCTPTLNGQFCYDTAARMSTQRIDAIEFTKRVQALIKDCLRRDNIPRCDRDAMLFAYGEVLDIVVDLCDLDRT